MYSGYLHLCFGRGQKPREVYVDFCVMDSNPSHGDILRKNIFRIFEVSCDDEHSAVYCQDMKNYLLVVA